MTKLDVRMIFYGLGRGVLWIVVISSCWSMYGYFRQFYISAYGQPESGQEKKNTSLPVVGKEV